MTEYKDAIITVAKKISMLGYIIAGAIFSILLISAIRFSQAVLETQQEKSADAVRIGKVIHAIKVQKATLKNASSMQVTFVMTDESAETICILYKVRNDSGHMHYETVSFYKKEQSKEDVHWQQHCTGGMYDMTSAGQSI